MKCCVCKEPTEVRRLCEKCHAAYMRRWRMRYKPNAEQAFKMAARSYAGQYKRRGLIPEQPCEVCGNDVAEMHHDDYKLRLGVRWLCRPCHMMIHGWKPNIRVLVAETIRSGEKRVSRIVNQILAIRKKKTT